MISHDARQTRTAAARAAVVVAFGWVALSARPAQAETTCLPECRSGFVCREGECVSACNPACSDDETCNAKRECVPRATDREGYPYDRFRFGVGGAVGVGIGGDGKGTPYGGLVAASFPLGGHVFSREDFLVTYYRTSADDNAFVGMAAAPGLSTKVEQSYLLLAVRGTVGYAFSPFINARIGALAGSQTLRATHGACGSGPVSSSDSSYVIGGTGALGITFKHIDLSATGDVYSANMQAVCAIPAGSWTGQGAMLIPERQLGVQVLGQATILF